MDTAMKSTVTELSSNDVSTKKSATINIQQYRPHDVSVLPSFNQSEPR